MKIKVKVTIENKDMKEQSVYNAIYIKEKDIIKYQEKDKTSVTLHKKDNILIRENKDIYMEYPFDESHTTDGILRLKDMDKEFLLILKTQSLVNKENLYKVEYKLVETKDVFTYTVEVEEKE